MLDTELTPGAPSLKKDDSALGDYSAIMGINGIYEGEAGKMSFRGSLVISWPLDTYIKSASAMLMEDYEEINEENQDVGLEICNITMGAAKKHLISEGYQIEMSIPNLISGHEHKVGAKLGVITIIVPFSSDLGEVIVEINYEDFSI